MKIRELQQRIADALNGVETLVQGGCKALAEDALDIMHTIDAQLAQAGGVVLVVTTPNVRRDAGGEERGLAVGMTVKVNCIEIPATNREQPGHLTALDAAEIVAHALDGVTFGFAGIEQYADAHSGTVTAAVTFDISTILRS